MSNKKLIFIWSNLEIGGIECWLIKQLKKAKDLGYDIIWIVNGSGREFTGWRGFIKNKVDKISIFNFNSRTLDESDEVLALCFGFTDYGYLLKQKRNTVCHEFKVFYLLPHFNDWLNYPDEIIPKIFTRYAKNKIYNVYRDADGLNQLLFFDKRHAEELYKRYGLIIPEINKKLVRISEENQEFDVEKARQRAMRNQFTIITCGRFDFPHKAYILGLISAYEVLKKEFKNIKLIIVGYGTGQYQVENKISKMKEEFQRDIILTGAVSPEMLVKYFDQSHVNISVAGAIRAGAVTGLVSIPARHYSEKCEVYGFLPKSKQYTLSDVPGEDVKKYIKYLINISNNEYIELCKKSFFAYHENNDPINDNWLFNIKQKSNSVKERGISKICLLFFVYQEVVNLPGRFARLLKRLFLFHNKI